MDTTISTSASAIVGKRDFTNFFSNTYGAWKSCNLPDRRPDFKNGKSKYWDYGDKVIRQSDHWGIVGSCYWKIDGLPKKGILFAAHCGEIAYGDFGDSKQERQKPITLKLSAAESQILRSALELAEGSSDFKNMIDDIRKLQSRIPYSENFTC